MEGKREEWSGQSGKNSAFQSVGRSAHGGHQGAIVCLRKLETKNKFLKLV